MPELAPETIPIRHLAEVINNEIIKTSEIENNFKAIDADTNIKSYF